MAECAFCGHALRPGASFCSACGHADAVAPARGPRARLAAAGIANPRAGVALVAMPLTFFLLAVGYGVIAEGMGPPTMMLVVLFAATAVVGGLGWAVAKGASWARWVALAATLLWGGFIAWTIPDQVRMLRDPYLMSMGARSSAIFGIVLVSIESVLAVTATYYLVRPPRS